jgi:succinylglutamate desuccinylase
MDSAKDAQKQIMTDLTESGEFNSIYFNEFGIGVSKHDIIIFLRRNGKAEAILNASHITAKAFVSSLGEALRRFEAQTNQTIPISDEIEKLMQEQDETNDE